MKILIITDAYPPEARSSSHLMKELADGLKERGHKVWVVTSRPAQRNLPQGAHAASGVVEEDGITVIRVNTLPHHNVSFVMKGLAQLALPYLFFHRVRKNIKGAIDAVWVHSPPLPLTITAHKVQRFYGAKYILNVQDFFPQNAIDLGVLRNKLLIRFFQRMERRAYRDCDRIVTPSLGHKRFLIEKSGVDAAKIEVVPHWIDLLPFQAAKRTGRFRKWYGLEGKFIFIFGGVMGPSQGLERFVRIASRLKEHKDIVFLFVGEGSEKEKLQALAKTLGAENVMFKPLVSREDYPALLKDANVGLLSLASANTTPAVPAKLMGYMAAGLPVLAFLHKESDGIAIVKEANCGLADVSGDDEREFQLARQIYEEKDKLKDYGENGYRYAASHFAKEVCLDRILKIL